MIRMKKKMDVEVNAEEQLVVRITLKIPKEVLTGDKE